MDISHNSLYVILKTATLTLGNAFVSSSSMAPKMSSTTDLTAYKVARRPLTIGVAHGVASVPKIKNGCGPARPGQDGPSQIRPDQVMTGTRRSSADDAAENKKQIDVIWGTWILSVGIFRYFATAAYPNLTLTFFCLFHGQSQGDAFACHVSMSSKMAPFICHPDS